MASIQKRNEKYCVVYRYKGEDGKQKQKWETFDTMAEAKKRKKEIEYKIMGGTFVVPKCVYVKDLLKEFVELYGKDKWALSTYGSNTALIRNYIEPMIGRRSCRMSPPISWRSFTRSSRLHRQWFILLTASLSMSL